MEKSFDSDDDDDFGRPSPLLQRQRFATQDTKDIKMTSSKMKHDEVSNLKINLNKINDDDDTSNDSVDLTRSHRSSSTSSSTPKPKQRSFLKQDIEKPKVKPRQIVPDRNDDDDDERNVFGKATVDTTPRYNILSLRDEEERDQSFVKKFSETKTRQSPVDMFTIDSSRKTRKNSSSDSENEMSISTNKEILSNKHDKLTNSQRLTTDSERRKLKEDDIKTFDTIEQDNTDSSRRTKIHHSEQDLVIEHDIGSNRHYEDGDSVTNANSQLPPSSTTRQSAIESIASVNVNDPMTSAVATTISTRPPPRPKSSFNRTTTTIHTRQKYKIPSRYQEITSRIDSGKTPVSEIDLTRSVEHALEKTLQAQTSIRSLSARTQKLPSTNERQRRRSSSAYEHIQPRINTNRSINFDQLNTSHLQNDSSQSIKDAVYYEWLKTKEQKRKIEKQEFENWKNEKTKSIDKNQIQRKIQQNAQNLERWREEKDKEIRKKRREEIELEREIRQKKKQEQEEKREHAKAGFTQWIESKNEEQIERKREKEHQKKIELEREQEEKQKHILEVEIAYNRWIKKKNKQKIKKNNCLNQFNEEEKYIQAKQAYEQWLKKKEDDHVKQKNSMLNQQQLMPFLPGGQQKNTGKIPHIVW